MAEGKIMHLTRKRRMQITRIAQEVKYRVYQIKGGIEITPNWFEAVCHIEVKAKKAKGMAKWEISHCTINPRQAGTTCSRVDGDALDDVVALVAVANSVPNALSGV